MVNIVLVEPEIPANTGNIARTCAATKSRLHLIKPLGFDISEKAVKRAGLDYWDLLDLTVYESLEDFFEKNTETFQTDPEALPLDLWLGTTKAPQNYSQATYSPDCYLFFGKETAGLPEDFRQAYPQRCVRIPMSHQARSLNLSNAVAVMTYEALRQQGFPQLLGEGEMELPEGPCKGSGDSAPAPTFFANKWGGRPWGKLPGQIPQIFRGISLESAPETPSGNPEKSTQEKLRESRKNYKITVTISRENRGAERKKRGSTST